MMSDEFSKIIRLRDFLVLDTETTGIEWGAEIIEIAIIDAMGQVLLNSRVKPTKPIPTGASRIHHIYDRDVESAPSWIDIRPQVDHLIKDRDVVIYNASYDVTVMESTDSVNGISPKISFRAHCAMLAYAEHAQVWNEYRGNWAWHKLVNACEREQISIEDAHSALGDCQMTLALINSVWLP